MADDSRLIVYTALVGYYDHLADVTHHRNDDRVDFVCFTDTVTTSASGWDRRPLDFHSTDPKRTALFYKTHPHVYFPDHECSIWMDSSVLLQISPRELVAQIGEASHLIASFLHPVRRCVFEEAAEVLALELDSRAVVEDQMRRYEDLGVPKHIGLHEAGVLVRHHNDREVVRFDERWWAEIDAGSRRDQLSFDVVRWLLDHPVHPLAPAGVNVRNSPAFVKRTHRKPRKFRRDLREGDVAGTGVAPTIHGREPARRPTGLESGTEDPVADVDIVVPVHGALAHVQRCVRSVLADTDWAGRLILVDDASDRTTQSWCADLAVENARVDAVHHESVRGFSASCNSGISRSEAPYVVVLNSDTVVAGGWIRKMRHPAIVTPRVGLVGPMSNAASYQSIPHVHDPSGSLAVNALPPGMSVELMNTFLEEITRDTATPLVATLNGFCLLLTRELIDEVGTFDEEAFPRGYGEEVDLTLRATAEGLLCAVAVDTYVYHAKSQSFGSAARNDLKKAGREILLSRYGRERLRRTARSAHLHPALRFVRGAAARLADATGTHEA